MLFIQQQVLINFQHLFQAQHNIKENNLYSYTAKTGEEKMRETTSVTHYFTLSYRLELYSCKKIDCMKSVVLNHCHLCSFLQPPLKTTHLAKNEIIAIFWGECISSYG